MDEEGAMALIVAILHPAELTPEEAFDLLDLKPIATEHLEKMRSAGFTYGQISEMCGISRGAIFNRIKRRRLRGMIDEEVE